MRRTARVRSRNSGVVIGALDFKAADTAFFPYFARRSPAAGGAGRSRQYSLDISPTGDGEAKSGSPRGCLCSVYFPRAGRRCERRETPSPLAPKMAHRPQLIVHFQAKGVACRGRSKDDTRDFCRSDSRPVALFSEAPQLPKAQILGLLIT